MTQKSAALNATKFSSFLILIISATALLTLFLPYFDFSFRALDNPGFRVATQS